jgi:hypothetical protein
VVQRIVHMDSHIIPPTNITNLFRDQLAGVAKKDKVSIRVGVRALIWAIWNIQNNFIFNNAQSTSFMQ